MFLEKTPKEFLIEAQMELLYGSQKKLREKSKKEFPKGFLVNSWKNLSWISLRNFFPNKH